MMDLPGLERDRRAMVEDARATTRSVSKVFALRAAQYPFLLLYVVLVPRLMGAEAYGEYALLVSLVAIAVSVADLGLSEVYGRFVPEFELAGDTERIVRLNSVLLAFKLCVASLVAGAFTLGLEAAYGERFPLAWLLMIVAAAFVADVGSIPYALAFGLNQMGKHAVREPVRRALNVALVVLLFHWLGLVGALLAYVLVELVLAVAYFAWGRRWFRWRDVRLDLRFLRPYLAFGFAVYLASGITVVWLRSGNALVDALARDPAEVAYYDMASQLFWMVAIFTLLVLSSLVPPLTKLLLAGHEGEVAEWSAVALKYTTILCTALGVGFVIAGQPLIPPLLGSEYAPVFPNASLLLAGTVPMATAQVGMVLGLVHRRPARYFVALCAAFATSVALSSILIPRYAAVGCSVATLAGTWVLATFMTVAFRAELVPALGPAARAFGLGLAFLPLALLARGPVWSLALGAAYAAAYSATLLATGTVRLAELRKLAEALRPPGTGPPG